MDTPPPTSPPRRPRQGRAGELRAQPSPTTPTTSTARRPQITLFAPTLLAPDSTRSRLPRGPISPGRSPHPRLLARGLRHDSRPQQRQRARRRLPRRRPTRGCRRPRHPPSETSRRSPRVRLSPAPAPGRPLEPQVRLRPSQRPPLQRRLLLPPPPLVVEQAL